MSQKPEDPMPAADAATAKADPGQDTPVPEPSTQGGPDTEQEFRAARGALKREAELWLGAAPLLLEISTRLETLRTDSGSAGLFQPVYDTYDVGRSTMAALAREGSSEFTLMAETLVSLARSYEQLDGQVADDIARLAWS